MTRVAIIAAMADELKPLVRGWKRESRNGVRLWRWRHGEGEWIAALAGIGTDAAARALAEIEGSGRVDALLSTGWAGALRGEIETGRAYGVREVVDARTGERFPAAAQPGGCLLVTSDRVAGPEEKGRLAATFGADLVDMEAAGIARLAGTRGIPFYCVKGVSDGPADRLPDMNGFISADGQFHLGRFVLHVLVRPGYWPTLARLRRLAEKSTQGIRDSVLGILDGGGTLRDSQARTDSQR
jgi:adenosylhomocysteine nucleosidase